MKGVLLAGGLGSRLHPLTLHDNKHVLPVGMKRMIEYPLKTLLDAGLDEIVLVTGGLNPGKFLDILGNGRQFGIKKLYYTYQDGNGGIAEALSLAHDFVGEDSMCVLLGDNFFGDSLGYFIQGYKGSGSSILIQSVSDPGRFGVVEFDQTGLVTRIVEKPTNPITNLAVLGAYIYDSKVWDIIDSLEPSARNELEITDVNNVYIQKQDMDHKLYQGFWSDMGTPDSLEMTISWLSSFNGKRCHHVKEW